MVGGVSNVLFSSLVEGIKYILHILSIILALNTQKSFEKKLLLLHNKNVKSIIGIVHDKCSV